MIEVVCQFALKQCQFVRIDEFRYFAYIFYLSSYKLHKDTNIIATSKKAKKAAHQTTADSYKKKDTMNRMAIGRIRFVLCAWL